MNWPQFLQETPVLTTARNTLTDDEFIQFLKTLYRQETPPKFSNDLTWHAFEQIGWPEGKRYCQYGTPEYALTMTRKTENTKIAMRCVIRQAKWKFDQKEAIQAHTRLSSLLPPKAQNQQLLQELSAA